MKTVRCSACYSRAHDCDVAWQTQRKRGMQSGLGVPEGLNPGKKLQASGDQEINGKHHSQREHYAQRSDMCKLLAPKSWDWFGAVNIGCEGGIMTDEPERKLLEPGHAGNPWHFLACECTIPISSHDHLQGVYPCLTFL